MDRVTDSDSVGRRFESDRALHAINSCEQYVCKSFFVFYIVLEEAMTEVKRLEYRAKDFERRQELLQDKLAPLTAEKVHFFGKVHVLFFFVVLENSGQFLQKC